MNIVCIGAGPAGLFFSLLMKQNNPTHHITVIEQKSDHAQHGWGLVFSEESVQQIAQADQKTAQQIATALHEWNAIDIHFKGQVTRSHGHAFSGISRHQFIQILKTRCFESGIQILHNTSIQQADQVSQLAMHYQADLLIASDGAHSLIRQHYAEHFQPTIEYGRCRYIWLGTHKKLQAFTFALVETKFGWFQAHAYQYHEYHECHEYSEYQEDDANTSTVIIETPQSVWENAGLNDMTHAQVLAFCGALFAEFLEGQTLLSQYDGNTSQAWQQFPTISCAHWWHCLPLAKKNIPLVLMGDAARTAHFSIGSGTKLAIEDAIELAHGLSLLGQSSLSSQSSQMEENSSITAALDHYQSTRQLAVLKQYKAAKNSMEWFENVARYAHFSASQMSYALLTRSQRISHENLRMRDAQYVETMEAAFAKEAFLQANQTCFPARWVPPMFTPFKVRELVLKNRVVVSPMAQYAAHDGCVGDYHRQHLGQLVQGGAGLVIAEMTCVAADARATLRCTGLYNASHISAWQQLLDQLRQLDTTNTVKIGVQLGHAGAKGATKTMLEGLDKPLTEGAWTLISASQQQYIHGVSQIAQEATTEDMARVIQEFVNATLGAEQAGFDWIELHCAHGYLLSSFISPFTNKRVDEFGGSVENRCRFPLQVFSAMRAVWPQHKPMSVRISANDWVEGGTTPQDALIIAALFKQAGADMIDCSSGRVTRQEKPMYGRMYQTPYADQIRNEVGIATIAVGGIFEADHVNSIIAAGRADLCAIARPHIEDPAWTKHQAEKLGFSM